MSFKTASLANFFQHLLSDGLVEEETARAGEGVARCLLCDNESFLDAQESRIAHAKARMELWHIPARSPDLNPVELYWAKVRAWLRAMDLADLQAGRPPVQKAGLKERVRRVLKSAKAKATAKHIFQSLRKRCEAVKRKKGGAIRG